MTLFVGKMEGILNYMGKWKKPSIFMKMQDPNFYENGRFFGKMKDDLNFKNN